MQDRTRSSPLSSIPASRPAWPFVARLASHLRMPLYRNGYALILSSTVTSGLGVVYWILAAHSYTTEAVGVNSAAISTMMFLAGISQLNLTSALMRFIPGAGKLTRRVVIYTYLISTAIGAVVSLVFILGINLWAPALRFLGTSLVAVIWLVSATMGWVIFVLQDSVLTGLRQAIWVPIENTVFSVVKIVLLLLFAQSYPEHGVFASWTLALLASVVPTNLLIFKRLIPRHMKTTSHQQTPLVPRQIAHYVAADYFGSLCWLATTTLLPVIVTHLAGATSNAYFYLAWTIAYSAYLIGPNMGSSLIVEATHDQAKLGDYSYRIIIQTARILAPVVAVLVIGAPYILRIFGNDYALAGADLLRLLALSAFPNMINALFISVARVQRRMGAIVVVLGSLCGLVLSLSLIFLHIFGIVGIGMAWLIGQTVLAVVLLFSQFRTLWSSSGAHSSSRAEAGSVVAYLAKLIGSGLGISGFVDHLFAPRRADEHISTSELQYMLQNVAIVLRLHTLLRWSGSMAGGKRSLVKVSKLIEAVLPEIPPRPYLPLPATWTASCILRSLSDVTVISLGQPRKPPCAVLKLAQTDAALHSMMHQSIALATLHADPRLLEWRTLLPVILTEGQFMGKCFFVEEAMSGQDARGLIADPLTCARMQIAAATAIGQLHRRTATLVPVSSRLVRRWIEQPLLLLQRWNSTLPRSARRYGALERLEAELWNALVGRTFSLSWIHGDFWAGNVLVVPDGSRVTGIVDWDMARPNDLPLLDLLQLLLSTRMLVRHCELGDLLCPLLSRTDWQPVEQSILETTLSVLPGDVVEMRTMLLLCWLRHVAANISKSSRYIGHWLWATKNIEPVLQCL